MTVPGASLLIHTGVSLVWESEDVHGVDDHIPFSPFVLNFSSCSLNVARYGQSCLRSLSVVGNFVWMCCPINNCVGKSTPSQWSSPVAHKEQVDVITSHALVDF